MLKSNINFRKGGGVLRVYNIFPNALESIEDWKERLKKIKYMNFDYVYINPFFQTGYAKNLYVPKNFYQISEKICDYSSPQSAEDQLKEFVSEAHRLGIGVIFEMILTHTSIDSDLVLEHPEWYQSENGQLKNFTMSSSNDWSEGVDVLHLNNDAKDPAIREEISSYWENLLLHYMDFDFDGVKIHCAFNLPEDLLKRIIKAGRDKREDFVFIGDNLGASFTELLDLGRMGFDYLFTSFKWWNLRDVWFLDQHYKLKNNVGLISFPENYDTERVAHVYGKNPNASMVLYALAAFMNKGVMIPIGYENGSSVRLDDLSVFDFDLDEENMHLEGYIKEINRLKETYQIFNEETDLFFLNSSNPNILLLKKSIEHESVLIAANLNFCSEEKVFIENVDSLLESNSIEDVSPFSLGNTVPFTYEADLKPGDVKIFYAKN
jgi:hypothetical protein